LIQEEDIRQTAKSIVRDKMYYRSKIKPVSVVSILLQLFAYILVPYSLNFFNLNSVSTYSIIVATAAPISVAITYYSDSSILAHPKSADLLSSLVNITLNAILFLFLVLLFRELTVSTNLYLNTLATPLVLLTILISYQISVNKVLGSHLIILHHHRLARLGGCTMPILVSVLQLILCLGLKISFLTSLVLGSILSLFLINAIIFIFLIRNRNFSVASINPFLTGERYSYGDKQFSPVTLACFHLRFLKTNFSGALGLLLASISTASITWLIYFFCGNEMTAQFFVAQKLFSPIGTINSVWLIPKTLTTLLSNSDRGYECRKIRIYSLVLIVMTLLCALTLVFIKFFPFASPFTTLENMPLTIILVLFTLTATQQVSILCTLPQITASRTGVILKWQFILIVATLMSATIAHLAFSHLTGYSSMQILFVVSAAASVYAIWGCNSYAHHSSSTYECHR